MVTASEVRELLNYDAKTGVFTWKQNRGTRKVKGIRAGSLYSTGYRTLKIDGFRYKEHRLAWLITYNAWPTLSIDHINGVRDDNRIVNLREATQCEQSQNRKVSPKNRHPGVYFCKRTGRFRARIRVNRMKIELGRFDTSAEAQEAYLKAKQQYHPFQPTPRYA